MPRRLTVSLAHQLGARVLLDAQTGMPVPYRGVNGP